MLTLYIITLSIAGAVFFGQRREKYGRMGFDG